MTYEQFSEIMAGCAQPVLLVEGTRALPARDARALTAFGAWLARAYPGATFRTGNATGSDAAFAQGVSAVDPSRLEFVLPYGGHGKARRDARARQVALSEVSRTAEERLARHTARVSPAYRSLLEKRDRVPTLRAKARYLLRDTLKVVGDAEVSLRPATAGFFYANASDPMQGGTGHTIRVCRAEAVPAILQHTWRGWHTR